MSVPLVPCPQRHISISPERTPVTHSWAGGEEEDVEISEAMEITTKMEEETRQAEAGVVEDLDLGAQETHGREVRQTYNEQDNKSNNEISLKILLSAFAVAPKDM